MAALFAGASHTLLTWVVFAFETTRQPLGLLPLLGGTAAAYLISGLAMRDSIMTEKISRRGVPLSMGPEVDFLHMQLVRRWATSPVVTIAGDESVRDARAALAAAANTHQGFPVIDTDGLLVGVVTRRELLAGDLDDNRPVCTLLEHGTDCRVRRFDVAGRGRRHGPSPHRPPSGREAGCAETGRGHHHAQRSADGARIETG